MEEYVEYLKQVFTVLRVNRLYVRKKKCEFDLFEIFFLDHIVGDGRIRMDLQKTKVIVE